jgi:glycosyltransferase involved in cell wall biosynthesis
MSKIRVAQFSTSESGGAAIAAKRLSNLLNSGGIHSELFTRDNLDPFKPGIINRSTRIFLGKIVTKIQEFLSVKKYGTLTPISISAVNINRILKSEYDIIHIHNWYNLFSERDLVRISKKFPIVFTLHDERILTGGCHVTLGCQKFMSGCNNCPGIRIPRFSLGRFSHLLENASASGNGITLVCPSHWLASQVNISRNATSARSVAVIPNAIDLPTESKGSLFDNTSSKTVNLLFVAANVNAHVKGLSFLLSTLSKHSFEFKSLTGISLNLTIVGSPKRPSSIDGEFNISYLGAKDSQQIPALMKDFDFLIVPSYSENLPNVISEAQLVGLPVIASNIAGIPDLVQESASGFLFSLEERSLIEAISRAVGFGDLQGLASRAREMALKQSDENRILEEHTKVYKSHLGLS